MKHSCSPLINNVYTFVIISVVLLEVVVPHARLRHVQAGPVQLRDERQPQRHLVPAVVAPHLWLAACVQTMKYRLTAMLSSAESWGTNFNTC